MKIVFTSACTVAPIAARHPDLCERFRRQLDEWEATMPASNPGYAGFSKKKSNP